MPVMHMHFGLLLATLIGAVAAGAQEAVPTPEQMQATADAAFLKAFADPQLADGFDFPVGDINGKGNYRSPAGKSYKGWYVAVKFAENYEFGIHTGEDWNGGGGGDSDLGQPVFSIGNGKVIYAREAAPPYGNIVVIQHQFLDNGRLTTIFSQYDHLKEILVKKDDLLELNTGVKVGTPIVIAP